MYKQCKTGLRVNSHFSVQIDMKLYSTFHYKNEKYNIKNLDQGNM